MRTALVLLASAIMLLPVYGKDWGYGRDFHVKIPYSNRCYGRPNNSFAKDCYEMVIRLITPIDERDEENPVGKNPYPPFAFNVKQQIVSYDGNSRRISKIDNESNTVVCDNGIEGNRGVHWDNSNRDVDVDQTLKMPSLAEFDQYSEWWAICKHEPFKFQWFFEKWVGYGIDVRNIP